MTEPFTRMPSQAIHDPPAFLAEFGGLHDVRVDRIDFDAANEALTLVLEDLHAVATGTSKHSTARPCALILREATRVVIDVETSEGIRIGEASIERNGPGLQLRMPLNLGGGDLTGGRGSIAAAFASLHIEDVRKA